MASTSETHADSTEEDQNGASTEIFPGCSSITEFSQKMLKTVVQATKASNDLPTEDNYEYYSTFDGVRNVMNMEARRLLHLMQVVMRHQNVKGAITGSDQAMEIDEQFDVMIDANDQILERVSTAIDEATGVKKKDDLKLVVSAMTRSNPALASWNKKRSSTGSPGSIVQLLTAKNVQRPQLKFKDKVNNNNKPFVPILRQKPNALKSLEESLQLPANVSIEDTEKPDFDYPHPYQFEIEQMECSPEQLECHPPQEVQPIGPTFTAQYVDTVADLTELCDHLKKQEVFAVDLEHHGNHSFQGFVCLMQLTTKEKDFIVDTLALRSDIHMLNQVFTDPKITKVFHGADSDIVWLQRDFGMYVVNMYDTGQAARVLNEKSFSLAHLLDKYCGVTADKQYQMADWRKRPLDPELLRYAQEDTHYLLKLYDLTRRDLIAKGNTEKNLLRSVFQRSKQVSLKVYRKQIFTPDSYKEVYRKASKVFNAQQLYALKAIYEWRDTTARLEDEGKHFVLPDHMLLQMADILPRERQGVLACCNPIPPLVRQYQHEIHSIIVEAREIPIVQTEERLAEKQPPINIQAIVLPWESRPLPHDLSHQAPEGEEAGGENMDVSEPVPTKSTSVLFKDFVKTKAVLSALMTAHDPRLVKKSKAGQIRQGFLNPILKFLPSKLLQGSPFLRPSAFEKVEKWRLKANTLPTGQKRKSDIDLNKFSPEFVPPAKSKRSDKSATPITINTASSKKTGKTLYTSTPNTSTPDTSTQNTSAPSGSKQKSSETEVIPMSYTEIMKKKKKEKKAKKKAALLAQETTTSTSEQQPTESQSSETQPSDGEKKKKKKKKHKLEEEETAVISVPEDTESGTPEKKKKKKKQGGSEESIMENITPFDYTAADKSALTGKTKMQTRPEVFNPTFHGGSKKGKQKKGKKKLGSGKKPAKSVTFKA